MQCSTAGMTSQGRLCHEANGILVAKESALDMMHLTKVLINVELLDLLKLESGQSIFAAARSFRSFQYLLIFL